MTRTCPVPAITAPRRRSRARFVARVNLPGLSVLVVTMARGTGRVLGLVRQGLLHIMVSIIMARQDKGIHQDRLPPGLSARKAPRHCSRRKPSRRSSTCSC